MYEALRKTVEDAYDAEVLTPSDRESVEEVIRLLDSGTLRVVSQTNGVWMTNEWIKKAILVYFKMRSMQPMAFGDITFVDKIPVKSWTGREGVRVVPFGIARYGSFVAPGAIIMSGYVNIGAYVGEETMVDTWTTIGSCAHIGRRVHVSSGVCIGGVLEPLQASPVIVEDDVFIGSHCVIVEGVVVGKGAVIGAGTTLTASSKIVDVTGDEMVVSKGFIPPLSVVIPGTLPKRFPAGEVGVPCALIIGKRSEKTERKVSLNNALREYDVSV